MDADKLKELREKHGRRVIDLTFTDEVLDEKYDFAVRPPTAAEFDRFMAKRPDDPVSELQRLAAVCTVYPERAEYDRLMKDYPALYVSLGDRAVELAGGAGAQKKP